MVKTNCVQCGKQFEVHACWLKRGHGRFCNKHCYGHWRAKNIKGKNHPQFIADTTNYNSVHDWMLKNFGKASKCENLSCPHKSKRFVWAKKHGKDYERKRVNFKQLCYKCHFQYDFNKEWHVNIIKGQHKRRYGI